MANVGFMVNGLEKWWERNQKHLQNTPIQVEVCTWFANRTECDEGDASKSRSNEKPADKLNGHLLVVLVDWMRRGW